ncbi:T9SS type B sorting domain-containing protein [Nonlabens xylanidelens]|nr:T9SS type B sorting domain-containing protein [Nonlabens xylanidelens]
MKRILFFLILISSYFSVAQTNINMPQGTNGGNGFRFVGCGLTVFNDSQGNQNYEINEDNISVFCPAIDTDRMQLDFLQVGLLAGDVVTIYDGDSTAAAVLGTITDTTAAAGLFQASAANPTGCLTVRFVSDGSGVSSGWRARRTCFDPCQTITTAITTTPAMDADGILRICQGDTVTFDGSATFSVDGTGATYEWDLANGNGLNMGQIQTETYTAPGIYQTRFIVTDSSGCTDRDEIDLIVQVSTDPDFTGTMADDTVLCFGESTTLRGVVSAEEFAIPVSPPVTGLTFLPDGSGVSYVTCIDVDLFAPGALIASASDLADIFVNLEHSWVNDLEIILTAPNGTSVILLPNPNGGGGIYFGQAVDDTSGTPGVGFDYIFTERATATQTLQQAIPAVGNAQPIPAGEYLPETAFSGLIGSPLNGQWCLTITDNLGADDGYIFFWGLNFDPAIIPSELSFTPLETTAAWQANPDIAMNTGSIVTVTPSMQGLNCYDYVFTDNHGCSYTEQVCIDVVAPILSGAPNDIVICDPTGSTAVVDLTVNDAPILNGLSGTNHVVSYFETPTDAENNTNSITNPTAYTNISNPQTIYTRITEGASGCNNLDSFEIRIGNVVFTPVDDLVLCDDSTNDGFEVFDLTSQSAGILNGQDPADNIVTFHTSQADADNNVNAIVNPDAYTNVISPVETIYVRIENSTDATCNATGTFDIIVAPAPQTVVLQDLELCDFANDGVELFDLTVNEPVIIAGQAQGTPAAPLNYVITYHTSPADALTGVNPIMNPDAYGNTSSPQTIFVRVESDLTSNCFNADMSFEIALVAQPVYNVVDDMVVCDDVTNDGVDIFDLNSQEVGILNGQDPALFNVEFYETLADAQSGTNAIIDEANYQNTSSPQTIYVRIVNSVNSLCDDSTGSFQLVVNALAIANPLPDVEVCDDSSNDGLGGFQFDAYTAQVLQAQDPLMFIVSYHESQADADSGANPLSTTSYTNISNPQTIYVRVESLENVLCTASTSFDLIINESPTITSAPDLTLCDDPSGDGVESFDLTQNDATILNGLNPADYTITYSNASGAITSPYVNVSSPETITVSVENNVTGCSDTTTFDLIVGDVPVTIPTFLIEECDEDGDGAATFILSETTTQITNGQVGTLVTFHDAQADALSGVNALNDASYDNTSSPQTIYYRIEFTATGCFAMGDFTIEAVDAPIAIVPNALESCDNGNGTATVDVSLASAEVTTGQVGSTVVYYLNQADADSQVNGITGNFDYSSDTTLIVRVDDDNTDCFSFTTLDLIFNELPAPSLLDQYVLCLDEVGNLVNGPVTLDTGLNNTDYSFEWSLDGTAIAASTASIDVSDGGDYEVIATDVVTGCSNNETTNVRISSVPDVYDIDITTDPFDKDHQVIVTAEGPDQYWFRLDDGPYVNNGTFNNVEPGPHTVTIAERSGCGEIVVDIFVFGYPDYFTPNADGIHDTWNIVGGDRLPGTVLYIFDRYGKLIKQLDVAGPGWDGNYNGQPLPSTDYWFKIEYAFDGEQREASGHFAMKR